MSEDEERAEISGGDPHRHRRRPARLRSAGTPGAPRSIRCGFLMEAGGLLYLNDSYADDLPYWIKARGSKPHLVIPYTLDANDMRFVNAQGLWRRG